MGVNVTTVFMFNSPEGLHRFLLSEERKDKLRDLNKIKGVTRVTKLSMTAVEPTKSMTIKEANFFMSAAYNSTAKKPPLNQFEQTSVIWLSVLTMLIISYYTWGYGLREIEGEKYHWPKVMLNLALVVPPVKFLVIPFIGNLILKIKLCFGGCCGSENAPAPQTTNSGPKTKTTSVQTGTTNKP